MASKKMAIDFGAFQGNMRTIFAKHNPAMVPQIPRMLAQVKQTGMRGLRGLVMMTKTKFGEDLEVPFFDLNAVGNEMAAVFRAKAPAMMPKVGGMLGSLSRGDFTLAQLTTMLQSKYGYQLKAKSTPENILGSKTSSSTATASASTTGTATKMMSKLAVSKPSKLAVSKSSSTGGAQISGSGASGARSGSWSRTTVTTTRGGKTTVVSKTETKTSGVGKSKNPIPKTRNGWKYPDWGCDQKVRRALKSIIENKELQKNFQGEYWNRDERTHYPQGCKEIKLEGTKALDWLKSELKKKAEAKGCDWKSVESFVFDKQYWATKKYSSDKNFKKLLLKFATSSDKRDDYEKGFVCPQGSRCGAICLKAIADGIFVPDYLECGIPVVMTKIRKKDKFFHDLRIDPFVTQCLLLAKLGPAPGMLGMFSSKARAFKNIINAVFNADIPSKNCSPPQYWGVMNEEIEVNYRSCTCDGYTLFDVFALLNRADSLAMPYCLKAEEEDRAKRLAYMYKSRDKSRGGGGGGSGGGSKDQQRKRLQDKLKTQHQFLRSEQRNGNSTESTRKRIAQIQKDLARLDRR